jgi:hypothetical protein
MRSWLIVKDWGIDPSPGMDTDFAWAFTIEREDNEDRRQVTVEFAEAGDADKSQVGARAALDSFLGDDDPPHRIVVERSGNATRVSE